MLTFNVFFFFLQAVTNINTLLDKADRVYHQLMGHRPQLESLLSKVNEAAPEKPQVSHSSGLNSTFFHTFYFVDLVPLKCCFYSFISLFFFCVALRMTLEQVQGLVHPPLM